MFRLAVVVLALVTTVSVAPAIADQSVPPPRTIVQRIDGVPVHLLADAGGGLPFLGASESYNAGDWEDVLRTYVSDGTYGRQLRRIDRLAVRQLRRARLRGVRRPAVVFDVDETLLSNYSAIDADNFTFGVNSRAEAQNQVGKRIAATKAVYDVARSRGMAIFLITGRGEDVRTPTTENLRREGFTGFRSLTLKPAGFEGTTVDYKAAARARIARRGFTILANVGDQFSDLAGGHARRGYKLPNPFYYLP